VLVALTGGIGSGKSVVAQMFAAHGAHVIKADDLAKEVTDKTGSAFEAVIEEFGDAILDRQGQIDRLALANIVLMM